jgi:DNA-binding transcriptional regulator YiaG
MGLSQAELAAEMGVTEFSVWRWENNKRDITVAHTTLLRMIFDERERAGRLKS